MKNLKFVFASLLLIAVTTLFATSAKAQSYYTYNLGFQVNASPAPSTTPLNNASNYTSVTGPLTPTPCNNGNWFCGFKTDITIPNSTVLQCILDRIKQEADNRIAANTSPWLQHNASFTVSCSGTTYTITTYLRSTNPEL